MGYIRNMFGLNCTKNWKFALVSEIPIKMSKFLNFCLSNQRKAVELIIVLFLFL